MSNNRKNKKVLIGKFLGLNASLDGGSTVTLGEAEYMKNYRIVCRECGMEIIRRRRCKLVENTDRYRCGKCGGKLEIR